MVHHFYDICTMLLSLFKKKIQPDLSFIAVDMHSHLLPGIDDGLQDIEKTISFMQDLHAVGYKKFICTPHILNGVHNNSPETILPVLDNVRALLKERNIPILVEAAAEYMVDDSFEELVKSDRPLLTFGRNNILIEMSYMAPSPNLYQVIFDLKMKGLNPILAHPERYNYYHMDFEKYIEIKGRDIFFQVNLLSLSGYYGKQVKKTAEKLIEKGMVEFIGTDMHHDNHLMAFKQLTSSKYLYDLLKNKPLLNTTLL